MRKGTTYLKKQVFKVIHVQMEYTYINLLVDSSRHEWAARTNEDGSSSYSLNVNQLLSLKYNQATEMKMSYIQKYLCIM
ncbi:hypothetical protein Syun_001853 [Stephania yunnanensis]|uniref:Uncharacterized protein n=1 Tax=Stephania yunnanensis TaxID=152371 RepID=A0AAP0LFN1_9MAGN